MRRPGPDCCPSVSGPGCRALRRNVPPTHAQVGSTSQLLVGALATVSDERDTIAEALLDDPVGQFDRGVEIFGILKLRPVEKQFRPLVERRKISPRKIINVTRWAKAGNSTRHFHRPSFSG